MRKRTGTSQLSEFNAYVASVSADADDRASIVREQIAEKEAELSDLRQLQRKLEAAAGTA